MLIEPHGGWAMTFEECDKLLTEIRHKQGTAMPLIRVDYGGTAYHGRLARADSDLERREARSSPFGVLVLEPIGLAATADTILQIHSIPEDGIAEIHDN
jgi:hypothetical protein